MKTLPSINPPLVYASTALPEIVAALRVDVAVLSNTFHRTAGGGCCASPGTAEMEAVAARLVRGMGAGRVVYRTLSATRAAHRAVDGAGCTECAGADPAFQARMAGTGALVADMCAATLGACFDGVAPVPDGHVRSPWWPDTLHPAPFVYRGMNEVLLATLLPALERGGGG